MGLLRVEIPWGGGGRGGRRVGGGGAPGGGKTGGGGGVGREYRWWVPGMGLGLYKIFFHLFSCVQESIIPLLPPPIRITHTAAIRLREFCAIYILPPTSLYMPYTIQYW